MNFSVVIKDLLHEKAQEVSNDPISWSSLCKSLLQEEDQIEEQFDEITTHLFDCITSDLNSKNNNESIKSRDSRFNKGILERPFYLAFIETLYICFESAGDFPMYLKTSQLFMLENKNLSRLEQIESEMKRIMNELPPPSSSQFNESHKKTLQKFLFTFLGPKDLNTFLGLRTTVGSSIQLPPALNDCVKSFTERYAKKNGKPLQGSVVKNSLTVGAKAFSKHFHRDTSNSFWGTCNGSEKQKNEQANRVLTRILIDAAWINLHSIVHDTRVFEIRNSEGYGARWEIQDSNTQQSNDDDWDDWDDWEIQDSNTQQSNDDKPEIMFRGFLEPQMEDGHIKGWVH